MKLIPLTQGQVSRVDDEDYERLSVHKWHARRKKNTFYAARTTSRRANPPKKNIFMHREIAGLKDLSLQVDHEDGDGLNNQRYNLRTATNSQNHAGFLTLRKDKTSKFRGVSWHKGTRKWLARLNVQKTRKYLGVHESEESAAEAYDAATLEHFGAFAQLNFPA